MSRGRGASRALRRASAAGALLVVVGLAGCAIPRVQAAAPVPEPTPTYTSVFEPAPATQLAPLRGATVPLGSLAHASIAAKIDNHEEARPQYGLDRADIVFEELVEGGLTRYVAVWQSNVPDLIGPVRSIRPMDPDIISPFGGIVAYSGGQEIFVDMMEDTVVYNAIHGNSDTDDTFYRTDEKESPHDVVVKAPEVIGQHSDLAAPAQQFAYSYDVASSTAAKEGTPTSRIDSTFSGERYPHWQWDAGRSQYLRNQEGAPDYDSAGVQLGATNLVVLRVGIDWTYGYVPRTVMVGSGEAWVSTGGGTIHATWSKADRGAPIRLVDDRGVVVRLAPGNTWVELIPDTGSVTLTP
ncbi:DUF3048 domain-containing protein [Amnibacterium flavum]|uniref:DUF3048 domain-containing protein n=1 Tax=Amnibacterium flavum TaxID=2173173 RepID=UPI0014021033|nr:DUF3048 domain-containing protein [Amnibacterium flavum]